MRPLRPELSSSDDDDALCHVGVVLSLRDESTSRIDLQLQHVLFYRRVNFKCQSIVLSLWLHPKPNKGSTFKWINIKQTLDGRNDGWKEVGEVKQGIRDA